TPQFVIFKNRSLAIDWIIYHVSTGTSGYFNFDAAAVRTLANLFTGISSTTIPVNGGYASVNGNGSTYVAYCFAPVESYSAFGSYTGNGSTDGPFVYTGFRPRWVMVKASSSTGSWYIYDSKRDTYNVATSALFPNSNSNELSIPAMDLLSNGLKLKYEATYGANYNGSGVTYVYAAFSEVAFNFARAR
ncbi:hypothetical protein EBT31_16680, partial [bacterium]|nr:hypothetical protein [bacterium]